MKLSKQKCKVFFCGFLYMSLGLTPVWADDTEIYFSPKVSNSSTTNIMFILDTSGSMNTHDPIDPTKAGHPITNPPKPTSRMDDLKIAFAAVIDSINNVNVGIMRFNNAGGPILYPVTAIDKELTDTSLPATISVTASTGPNGNDAYQFISDGVVFDSVNQIAMGHDVVRTVGAGSVVTFGVSAGSNDVEYKFNTLTSAATFTATNTTLKTPRDVTAEIATTKKYNGIRFIGSTAASTPAQNAKINAATLNLYAQAVDATGSPRFPLTLVVAGEAVDQGAFANTATKNPRARYQAPGMVGLNWDLVNTSGSPLGTGAKTFSVTSLVQSMVDQSAWATAANRNPTFLIAQSTTVNPTATGLVEFGAFENSTSARRPTLTVDYKNADTIGETVTALRFTNINIPKGVTITSAHIDFTASTSDATPTNLRFYGELANNSTAISSAANNISGRTKTTAAVDWTAVPAWTAANVYSSPELKTIVQEIVNQGSAWDNGWCGDNAMTILVTSDLGRRIAKAYESGAGYAPKLSIQYDPSTMSKTNSCRSVTVTRQIINTTDDAEDRDDGTPQIALGNSSISMPSSNAKPPVLRQSGFHFTNVQVPKSASITSAYLEFTAKNGDNATGLNLTIKGFALDNPGSFFSPGSIRNPGKTSASVSWSNVPAWTAESVYQSANIATIVQELVNRPADGNGKGGWELGNSMSFAVLGTDTANRRRAYAVEGGKTKATRLVVKFRDNGSYVQSYRVRDLLKDTVDAFTPGGNTPSQDTLYEAALYFIGDKVDYGSRRGGMAAAYCPPNLTLNDNDFAVDDDTKEIYATGACVGPFSYGRVSAPESLVGGASITPNRPAGCTSTNLDASACAGETLPADVMYQSPVLASCSQSNAIVFLTDGEPNSEHSTAKVKALTGVSTCADTKGASCVTELTKSLFDKGIDTKSGVHTKITTHAIGLYEGGGKWLQKVATEGGGKYYTASNAQGIQDAFKEIVDTVVTATGSSFVAAGTAVNAFDRTLNRDELFFSVFEPDAAPRWLGNVKKYKLSSATSPTDPLYLKIVDASNPPKNAVDTDGFFADGSLSYWSDAIDGPEVDKGGAGGEITSYLTRKVYTYYDKTHPILSDPVNQITSTTANLNTSLTKTMFNAASYTDDQFGRLIDWILGRNYGSINDAGTPTDTRFVFGDPLHSRPISVTFGGTETSPDMTLFVTTNAGFLHAIDNTDGHELFSFIPQELLPIQKDLLANVAGAPHIYGLDSTITPWVIDPDGDGIVLGASNTIQTNNRVLLFFGMRAGGRNLYALDVTDRANPKILWDPIKGGVTPGFNALGDTWSQPVRAQINVDGTIKKVLIFGGGYDAQQDSVSVRTTDSMGNGIFIVDALSGALIWSGGKNAVDSTKAFSDMSYSIPGQVAGGDVNGDGLMDVLFVGDMGGQVWRFDIHNGQPATTLVTGGVIADIGGAASAENNRRFYQSPSIYIGVNKGTPYLGVAIGSGYRAHPLDEATVDRFYAIRQSAIFSAPATYTKLTEASFFDASDNSIGEGTADVKTTATANLAAAAGWYITLPNTGEKVLSTPTVVGGVVYFTTYEPTASTDPCKKPEAGKNRSYEMSVFNATPTLIGGQPPTDANEGTGKAADRSVQISSAGIVDQQRLLFRKLPDNKIQVLKLRGTDVSDTGINLSDELKRVYWYENRQ